VITPGLIDSHTHFVYGGSREAEFAMRIAGNSYEEIARSGGGIASSVEMTKKTSEEELFLSGKERIEKFVRHGTTTIECKSGYGLDTETEMKILRAINRLKKDSVLDIVPTYLVHSIPKNINRDQYVDQVCGEILPEVVKNKLAIFCDIFCDEIAFSVDESRKVLNTARELGFALKIHADELSDIGAAALAAEMGCVSADHLEFTSRTSIKAMNKAGVIPTLLPGTAFFLQIEKKPDINGFLEENSPVAIASDYNPGSCMIYSMLKIISIACIVFRLPVENALIAATHNAARALKLEDKIGSIKTGKQADLIVCDVDNYRKIPYNFGEDIVRYTIKKGKVIYGKTG
ncbi:imidazolonepropionase, partial [candidate division WOR-3 bacterium RBG_13_43_14]